MVNSAKNEVTCWYKKLSKFCVLGVILLVFCSSCTVTNNLYVNNPFPVDTGKVEMYVGVGTGMQPKMDSIDENGDITFTDQISTAPNLCIGAQFPITRQLNIRAALHFPFLMGGFGIRVGPQYSLFTKDSKFNMAVGCDLGFVVAKDSIELFGSTTEVDSETNGALNADLFVPIGFQLSSNVQLIITARYSFNALFVRYNINESKSQTFHPAIPSVALGAFINSFYFEASAYQYENEWYPNFGLVYIIDDNIKKAEPKE